MIYIITPRMSDFRRECLKNKLFYSNGRSTSDVKWINHVVQLYGMKIHKHDKVIKGEEYADFSPEEMHRIEIELALRMKDEI